MAIYFTREHEWAKVDGACAIVGITEHAAHELGDVTFVELPKAGCAVAQFGILASIESVKAASDIFSPLSGRVTRVNDALEASPEIVNESPEEKGWICELSLTDPAEVKNLMSREEYDAYLHH